MVWYDFMVSPHQTTETSRQVEFWKRFVAIQVFVEYTLRNLHSKKYIRSVEIIFKNILGFENQHFSKKNDSN